MKLFLTLFAAALCLGTPAMAASIGQPAPDFTAKDTRGADVSLAALKGKTVVLEWTNHECPFVHKHYDSGNMQTLQADATRDGVIWISIISSAKDKEGYVTAAEANANIAKDKSFATHLILDADGHIGHLYGAKTTPHMFVINKDGVLVYAGAIDDKADTDFKSVEGARNYVREALADLKNGVAVKTAQTNPYGCGVKY